MAQTPPPPFDVEIEHRLTALETRLDVILPTLATKADIAEVKAAIAESKSSLLVWGITTAVAVVAILVSVMFFLAEQLQLTSSDESASQRVSQLRTESAPTSATIFNGGASLPQSRLQHLQGAEPPVIGVHGR